MYSATNYNALTREVSPTYQIVQIPDTAESTIACVKVERTETNLVVYPNTIRVDITVVLPPPEPRERKPKPIRNPVFQPPVREISNPWQARWRLTQQRARDGLR